MLKGKRHGLIAPRVPSIKKHAYKGNGRTTTSLAQRNASRRNVVKAQLTKKARYVK